MSKAIVVTGACGNLGYKLIESLSVSNDYHIVAIDCLSKFPALFDERDSVSYVQADLTNPEDTRWIDVLKQADTVVHFAAKNPFPDASWEEATASFVMTKNLVDASLKCGVKRFVNASSNHVMGGYKDDLSQLSVGFLSADRQARPGTAIRGNDGSYTTSLPYAVSKIMSECHCHEAVSNPEKELSIVSIRIGWCQPGENKPSTISASGTPKAKGDTLDLDYERDLRWFRSMWLSNSDFVDLYKCAIQTSTKSWPSNSIIVNGVSANADMPWDIEAAQQLIGYRPKDDLFKSMSSGNLSELKR